MKRRRTAAAGLRKRIGGRKRRIAEKISGC
jgi:hypothetical protein